MTGPMVLLWAGLSSEGGLVISAGEQTGEGHRNRLSSPRVGAVCLGVVLPGPTPAAGGQGEGDHRGCMGSRLTPTAPAAGLEHPPPPLLPPG